MLNVMVWTGCSAGLGLWSIMEHVALWECYDSPVGRLPVQWIVHHLTGWIKGTVLWASSFWDVSFSSFGSGVLSFCPFNAVATAGCTNLAK